jgi:hypothetical protein
MALFDITAEDVARGTLLAPGWYIVEVKDVKDDVTKKGESCVKVTLTALDGKDDAGEDAPSVPLYTQFMPMYPSFVINFLNALGANIGKTGKANLEVSNATCQGKKLKVYVKRSEYNGQFKNEVADYRPLDS